MTLSVMTVLLCMCTLELVVVTGLSHWERQSRNNLIVHYGRQQSYTALEIVILLAFVHGYTLR